MVGAISSEGVCSGPCRCLVQDKWGQPRGPLPVNLPMLTDAAAGGDGAGGGGDVVGVDIGRLSLRQY